MVMRRRIADVRSWTTLVDGLCAVDIVHKESAIADQVSPTDLKTAVGEVMIGCVYNGRNEGGILGGIGKC